VDHEQLRSRECPCPSCDVALSLTSGSMSVTVKHLNDDTTFLLIFSPESNPLASDLKSANGAYTVLIDPWLNGPSVVSASWFATTEHQIPSAIQHLSEIEEPDVVVVSQNKPDHCHKQTLLQLKPEAKTIIAAEPGAAKTIKGWNHFDPNRVFGLAKYDPQVKFGRSLRLRIPPLSPTGYAGEVNIAFIPAKHSMTGLHNAFGITYLPPTRTKSLARIPTIDLPKATRYFHMPLNSIMSPGPSPPPPGSPLHTGPVSFDLSSPRESTSFRETRSSYKSGHRPRASRSSDADPASSELEATAGSLVQEPRSSQVNAPFHFDTTPSHLQVQSTPPHSPTTTAVSSASAYHRRKSSVPSHQRSLSSVSWGPHASLVTPARPKALSIIYTPHGLSMSDLQPYVQNHLVRLPGALPVTLLFHSFDQAQNPWYLGGNITIGAAGGVHIARTLMARCWVSAHDECKNSHGLAVKRLKVRRIGADEVRKALWEGEDGDWARKMGWTCDVRSLGAGKEMCVGAVRDLCSGMEGKRESRLLKFGPG